MDLRKLADEARDDLAVKAKSLSVSDAIAFYEEVVGDAEMTLEALNADKDREQG